MQIKVKYHYDEVYLPRLNKIEQGDWIDLRAAEHVVMKKGDFMYIPLGISVEMPKGYEAHIVPRSSTYKRYGIIQANHMGVVDNSYNGDEDRWFMPAIAMRDTEIIPGERICQFRLIKNQEPLEIVEVETLGNDERAIFLALEHDEACLARFIIHLHLGKLRDRNEESALDGNAFQVRGGLCHDRNSTLVKHGNCFCKDVFLYLFTREQRVKFRESVCHAIPGLCGYVHYLEIISVFIGQQILS